MSLAVVIELGHRSTLKREVSPNGMTHDWEVYVRGKDDAPIEKFIEKVVFMLHKDFPNPIRSVRKPPFTIKEAGYGCFQFPIEIHYKNQERKKDKFDYDLVLKANCDYGHLKPQTLVFEKPSGDWKRRLVEGGAVSLSGSGLKTVKEEKKIERTMTSEAKPPSSASNSSTSPKGKIKPAKEPKESKPKISNSFLDIFGEPAIPVEKKKKDKQEVKKERSGSSSKCDKDKSRKEKSKDKERSSDKSKEEDKKKENSKHKKDVKIEPVEPKKDDIRIASNKVKELTKKDKVKATELEKTHDKSDRKGKEKKEKSEKLAKERTEDKSHRVEKEKFSEEKAKEAKNDQKKDDRKYKNEEKKKSEHKEKRKKDCESKGSEKLISNKHSTDKKEVKDKVKVEQKPDIIPRANKEFKDKTHDKVQESTKTKHEDKKLPRKDKIASKTMPVSKGTAKPDKKTGKNEKDFETSNFKASEHIFEKKLKVRKESSSSVSSVSLSSPSQVLSSDCSHTLSPERSKPSMPLEKLLNNISSDSSSCESDFGSPGAVRKREEKEVSIKKQERPLSHTEEERENATRGKVPPKLVMSDAVNRSRSPSADLTVKQVTPPVNADNLKKQTNKNKYPSTLYRLAVQNKERENELLQKEKENAELKAKEAKKLEENAKRVAKTIGSGVVRPAANAWPGLTDPPAVAYQSKVKVEVQSPTTSSSSSESEESHTKKPITVPEPRRKPSQTPTKKLSADENHLLKRSFTAATVKAEESSSEDVDESNKRCPPPRPGSRGVSQKRKSPNENESAKIVPLRPVSRGASRNLKTPSDDDKESSKSSPLRRPTSRGISKKIEHCTESFSSSDDEEEVKSKHVNSLASVTLQTKGNKTSKTQDKKDPIKGFPQSAPNYKDISKKLKESREPFSSSEDERDVKTKHAHSHVTSRHAKSNQIIKTFDTELKKQLTEKNSQDVTNDDSSSTSEDENDARAKVRDSLPAAQHAMKAKRTIKTDGIEQEKKLMNKKKREILAAKLKKHSSLSESSTSSKESEVVGNKPAPKKSLFTKQNGRSMSVLEAKNSGQNSKKSDSLSDSSSDTETDIYKDSKLTLNEVFNVKVEKREDKTFLIADGGKQNGIAFHSDMKKVSGDKIRLEQTSEINKIPRATLSDDENMNFRPLAKDLPKPVPLLPEDSTDEEVRKRPKFPPRGRKTSLLSKTKVSSSSSDASDSESDEAPSTLVKKSRSQKRLRDASSERIHMPHPGIKRLPQESVCREKSVSPVHEDYLEIKPAGAQGTGSRGVFTDHYWADLLELQNRVCSVSDPKIAQRIVDIVGETECFEISADTFDFDACKLDLVTFRKLRSILNF